VDIDERLTKNQENIDASLIGRPTSDLIDVSLHSIPNTQSSNACQQKFRTFLLAFSRLPELLTVSFEDRIFKGLNHKPSAVDQ